MWIIKLIGKWIKIGPILFLVNVSKVIAYIQVAYNYFKWLSQFQGIWLPEGENVKIPVAIKVLQEGTSDNQTKELLEEARIMTSVVHPGCIRILAVCMTVQIMLITQLMPLGCLLDYVRKNKTNICSKVMLNWCTQIAKVAPIEITELLFSSPSPRSPFQSLVVSCPSCTDMASIPQY